MKQNPYMTVGKNGMKQKPCMMGMEKRHKTKAKYEGKNGMKQKPNMQGKTA